MQLLEIWIFDYWNKYGSAVCLKQAAENANFKHADHTCSAFYAKPSFNVDSSVCKDET